MGWVKLDDCFVEHPKVERAGDLAAWLYVCGLQYCSRALSDGFIPDMRVGRLTMLKNPQKLADKLVEVGLWEPADGGYQVHDYTEHQRSAAETKERRRANSERVAKHRAGKAGRKDSLYQRVYARDKQCLECGAIDDLTIDHIQPLSQGGATVEANLRVLCRSCNGRRNALLAHNGLAVVSDSREEER